MCVMCVCSVVYCTVLLTCVYAGARLNVVYVCSEKGIVHFFSIAYIPKPIIPSPPPLSSPHHTHTKVMYVNKFAGKPSIGYTMWYNGRDR